MPGFRKIIDAIAQRKFMARDFILNILASMILTGATQLVVYPLLAREFSVELYGIILTIMGVGNVIVTTFGNSLNNVRLLMQGNYEKENVKGDFLLILLALNAFSSIAIFVFTVFFAHQNHPMTVLLLVIYVILGNLRGYGVVTYRIVLNFRKNLICSIGIALGQLLGVGALLLFHKDFLWPLVFVLGEAVAIPILLKTSDIFQEPVRKTLLFSTTCRKTAILIFTSLIANLLIYLDRLLLLPVLGAESVSIYTTASFLGKSLGMLLTPIASVLLGYYAQNSFVMTVRKFRTINLIVLAGAAVFFAVTLLLAKPVTGILYPTIIGEAVPYLALANLAAIISVVGNMTQPAVLKYAPLRNQIYIQIGYCVIYLGGGVFLANRYALTGFSYAAITAATARLLALYILGEKYTHGTGV